MLRTLLPFLVICTGIASAEVTSIGSRRELFVDKLLIDQMKGASLRLHHPEEAGIAVKFDQPWEGRFSAYITVIHNDEANKFQMYYRGNAGFKDGTSGEVTCYAESPDGIRWVKPKLGLHEINGSKDNNVMLANLAPYTHNFAPFIDRRPGVPKEQRYKALAGLGGKYGGLSAFVSADGLHWQKMQEAAVITKGAFDSQNVSFWSDAEQCYVAYFRVFTEGVIDEKNWKPKGVRWVSRATSKDFVTWTDAVQMTCDQPLVDHIYISQTNPYFNAPHLYISTAARFMPGKAVLDEQAKKYIAEDTKAYPALIQDCSEAVLMTSRAGTTAYNRSFMEGFVRPGLHFRNWTSRSNYPACGVVQTGKSEMSLYVERHYGQSTALLQRLTLRIDGFASLHADYSGGEMTTKPFTFTGKALHLNLSTGAAGSVAVEIQDAEGKPLPGFTLDDCKAISYDDIDRVISWKSGSDVSALAGKNVRLRWVLKDADVFSFRFE
ncbi:MAG: hypothetical protein K9N47_23120 [Prosthecobacter sp.]|uniref:hypothetical protein n=1 Tax=Prosthecobacter sp. TaxID=1965333 RepID=UPI00261E6F57|nr:hypothetical protein [Prosthecobacter sp.]MCF7789035.1 hypothetical protein [Prosthecobacter sp.]